MERAQRLFPAFFLLLGLLGGPAWGASFTETFDGWTDDTGYAGVATYTSSNGVWASNNALASSQSGTSIMVRFQRNAGADVPWLEYRGLDGNGVDGGVGTVSFLYRHWNGLGLAIAFQLQVSVNGGPWVNTGPNVSVPTNTTAFQTYSHDVNTAGDNIKLRVLSTVNDERLLIDDFSLTPQASGPVIRFVSTSATVNETNGPVTLYAVIAPPAAASAQIAQTGGAAQPGSDFAISPTTLVFSAGSPTATVSVTLVNDAVHEETETAVWSLVGPVGATIDSAAGSFTLTLQDDDTVTVSFDSAGRSVGEAAGTVLIPVTLSRAANASVAVAVGGTLLAGTDYTLASTTLVFSAAGPLSQNLTVQIQEDSLTEGAETLVLTLVNPVGASLAAPSTYTLTVEDNESNLVFTMAAANLTSGTGQSYENPGIRILQALRPDIVGIQEFNTTHPDGLRGFVDSTFGTNFHYMIEPGDEQIPNGIISRWPIVASGQWADAEVSNRDFAWATIDIPGETNLHVVSVHFSTASTGTRNSQAQEVISQVRANFPSNDYIVLAGDLNTATRTESAVTTLKSVFYDTRKPVDQLGEDGTNASRDKPYDWVLPNLALNLRHVTVTLGGISFTNGLVFDTRLWGGSPPVPALANDSGASGMQHMAVMKAFSIPTAGPVLYAALGTPYAWLISYGFTNNFDSAELTDTDLDGMFAWEEYIAGTVPTNGASYFAVTQVAFTGGVAITFGTRPGRRYVIEYSDSYANAPSTLVWQSFATPAAGVFVETSPAPGTHTFVDDFGPLTTGGSPGRVRTYRVSVSLP